MKLVKTIVCYVVQSFQKKFPATISQDLNNHEYWFKTCYIHINTFCCCYCCCYLCGNYLHVLCFLGKAQSKDQIIFIMITSLYNFMWDSL